MKSTLFLAGVLLATSAYAGVNGTTILSYSILNNTGSTANSLNVNVSGTPTVDTFAPFTTANSGPGFADFSGGTVNNGDAATFTLEETGINIISSPLVSSYQWSTGSTESPLELFFAPTGPGTSEIELFNPDSGDHSFEGLYAMVNGSSILTVPTSGSLTTLSSEMITNNVDFSSGPVTFGGTDTTLGVTIQGEFISTPEPATTGLCALMFLGLVIAARRRLLRQG